MNIQDKCYEVTKSKGFRLTDYAIQTILIATEVEEALQAINIKVAASKKLHKQIKRFRKAMIEIEEARYKEYPGDVSQIKDKDNYVEELTDIIIRVLSIMGSMGVNAEEQIEKKLIKNMSRPKRHNKCF